VKFPDTALEVGAGVVTAGTAGFTVTMFSDAFSAAAGLVMTVRAERSVMNAGGVETGGRAGLIAIDCAARTTSGAPNCVSAARSNADPEGEGA
jgi:hypothetical protein